MNQNDLLLQSLVPTVMVPRFEALQALTNNGHRFLMAANGLWLEILRPWIHARVRVSEPPPVAMPYGTVEQFLDLRVPGLPIGLLRQFMTQARDCSPIEHAAWIVWDEITRRFALRDLRKLTASPGHVHFERPALADGEHLVLDLHTHGESRAYFSSQDDADDRGEIKISCVVGRCHQDKPSILFRLCALGKFLSLSSAYAEDGELTWSIK